MIQLSTIEHSIDQMVQLDRIGLNLSPKANTALALLLAQSLNTLTPAQRTDQGYLIESEWVCRASEREEANDTFNQIVATLAKPIAEQSHFARTVVNPDCDELINRIDEISNASVSPAISAMNIKRIGLPEVYEYKALVNLVQQYGQDNVVPFKPLRIFPLPATNELLDLLKVGNKDLDELIDKWFVSVGPEFFLTVFDNFFVKLDESQLPRPVYDLTKMSWSTEEGANIAIALFLWTNRLVEDTPESLAADVRVPVDTYKNYLRDVRDYAATRVVGIIAAQKNIEDAGVLVNSVIPADSTVVVNNSVYLDYLNKHEGTNEALFGLLVSGRNDATLEMIVAKKAELEEAYYRYAVQLKAADNANKVTTLRKIFVDCFKSLLISKELAPQAFDAKFKQAQVLIWSTSSDDLLDSQRLHKRVIQVVCEVLYPNTAADTILESIVNTADREKLTEAREAASLAILNWIVDYLMSMTEVTNFTTVNV